MRVIMSLHSVVSHRLTCSDEVIKSIDQKYRKDHSVIIHLFFQQAEGTTDKKKNA